METIDVPANVRELVQPGPNWNDGHGASQRNPVLKQVDFHYEMARERGSELSVVIAGLDGFRVVSDYLGPIEGDPVLDAFVLAAFATSLGERIEIVTHLVADQFLGVLSGEDASKAGTLAEALREDVAGSAVTVAGRVTASFGVAAYPESARGAEELVYGAQAAMYWAKAKGGNRVGYWGEMIGAKASKRPGAAKDPMTALAIALEWKIRAEPGQLRAVGLVRAADGGRDGCRPTAAGAVRELIAIA